MRRRHRHRSRHRRGRRIYGLAPVERSRINAIYMVSSFLGGALGTAVAAQAWQHGGWLAVCSTGGGFAVLAMLPLYGA